MNIKNKIQTKNGVIVITPAVRKHLEAHPEVNELIEEAAAKLTLTNDKYLAQSVDLDKIIGESSCVSQTQIDLDTPCTFALRIGRSYPSRVVIGENKIPCTEFTFIAKQLSVGCFELISAWCGPLAPSEPGDCKVDTEEWKNSFEYWSTHALVYDPSIMNKAWIATWRTVLGL